jgi:hypothetical protein
MAWNNLSNEDKEKCIGLQLKLDDDSTFKQWMMSEWMALYEDINNGAGLYPYFYSKIEEEYENFIAQVESMYK